MRKAIDYLNNEKPFMVLSVFNCDKSEGCIYVEAHKLSHVKSLINGITNVYKRKIEMIPFKDMTQLLKICSEMSENKIEDH